MEFLKYYYRIFRSILGSIFYQNPASKLKLIGVTGTSGKSTTTSMIFHILKESGFKVGIISTVGAMVGDKVLDTGFHVTTPDPIQLQKLLKFMKDNGAEYVVLETSSHALAQGRLGLLNFDYAVFTNIKSDHLDWHKTWENYAASKFKLIEKLKSNGTLIINKDDQMSYDYITKRLKDSEIASKKINLIEYSKENSIQGIMQSLKGIDFQLETIQMHLNLLGEYNLSNFLAAVNLAKSLGLQLNKISEIIQSFKGLEGRMEILQSEPFGVIVDFAHNADSLENSLKSIQNIKESESKIITVFGSAGLRDVQKRFDMGKVSGELSNITIVTAEDPRTESLKDINSKIIEGLESSGAKVIQRFGSHGEYLEFLKDYGISKNADESTSNSEESSGTALAIGSKVAFAFDYPEVQNRFDAIELAILLAQPSDIVITQGKGHEKSLAFGTTEYPFSDQEAVRKVL